LAVLIAIFTDNLGLHCEKKFFTTPLNRVHWVGERKRKQSIYAKAGYGTEILPRFVAAAFGCSLARVFSWCNGAKHGLIGKWGLSGQKALPQPHVILITI
jgi:hypothetical protein